MKLHLITATDVRTANDKAMALYGRDVLIVSSAQVNGVTELIVAAETPSRENEINGRTTPARKIDAHLAGKRLQQNVARQPARPAQVADSVGSRFEDLLELSKHAASESSPELHDVGTETSNIVSGSSKRSGNAGTENKSAPPRKRRKPAARPDTNSPARAQELVTLIRDEIHALRTEFNLSLKLSAWRSSSPADPALKPLLALLESTGMTAGLRSLFESGLQGCRDKDQAIAHLESVLNDAARAAESVCEISAGTHVFYGPSGAGKTTFVAKLANKLAQSVPADNIALISLSDQRPGAWNQLQLLASRSGARCYRATDRDALNLILDEIGSDSFKLIDIPASSGLERVTQAELPGEDIHLHAVIPASASSAVLRKFSCSHFESLILTKLDEVDYAWGLFHLMTERKLRISLCSMNSSPESHPAAFSATELVRTITANIRNELEDAATMPDAMALAAPPVRQAPALQPKGPNHG
jgi:flagellar biosynthesis GTPase FlhF